jgi:two-component system, OmpR family, sensor kinase
MSVTASSRADRGLWWGWLVFAGANTVAMFVFAGAETVPFHFVWISLSVVYGLQLWSSRRTYTVLAVVGVLTGSALVLHVHNEVIGWEETTEVPLMTLVFLAMVWHVRRRTKAEQRARQLAESEREMREALRRFVRFASHELRTPMTVAGGYAELIRDNATDDQTREDAIVVLEELETLNGIAGRLLTLARSEQRDLLREQDVDVDSLLQRAVKRWRPAADRVWSIDTHTGVITADQERLEAALDCLLDNALRYTEEGISTCAVNAGRAKQSSGSGMTGSASHRRSGSMSSRASGPVRFAPARVWGLPSCGPPWRRTVARWSSRMPAAAAVSSCCDYRPLGQRRRPPLPPPRLPSRPSRPPATSDRRRCACSAVMSRPPTAIRRVATGT